jgi:hypothetical protein
LSAASTAIASALVALQCAPLDIVIAECDSVIYCRSAPDLKSHFGRPAKVDITGGVPRKILACEQVPLALLISLGLPRPVGIRQVANRLPGQHRTGRVGDKRIDGAEEVSCKRDVGHDYAVR